MTDDIETVPNSTLNSEAARLALKNAVIEGAANLVRMQGIKDDQKFLIDSNSDALKVPKSILRKMIAVYHKQTFGEEVAKASTFEEVYTTAFGDTPQ